MLRFKFSFFYLLLCCLWIFDGTCLSARTHEPLAVPSLTVSVDGQDIELEWRLGPEQTAGDFQLERSLDGEAFIALGKQQLVKKNKYGTIYTYLDEMVLDLGLPKFFYRLKHTSQDGHISYSDVQEVSTKARKKELTLIGYNKVGKDKYVVHFNGRGQVGLRVVNTLGEVKFKQKYSHMKAAKTVYLFTQNWKSGAYVIELMQGKTRARYKLVLP